MGLWNRRRDKDDEPLELYRGWATVRLTKDQNKLAIRLADDVNQHLLDTPSTAPRVKHDVDASGKSFCSTSFGPNATCTVSSDNVQFIYRMAYLITLGSAGEYVRVETYDYEQPYACVAHIPT